LTGYLKLNRSLAGMGGKDHMKKVIVLAVTIVFLWAGVSFAENWIVFFVRTSPYGDSMKTCFDADRVFKSGNRLDYWIVMKVAPSTKDYTANIMYITGK
jgi:hypothetical protein